MKRLDAWGLILTAIVVLIGMPRGACAQGSFQHVAGKAFESAIPSEFYLEGDSIPVEKRNAVLLKTPAGARLAFALVDTAGYSSQINQKYAGMVITEGKVSICSIALSVGSYGFGLEKPAEPGAGDAKFSLYNQAGEKIGGCAAKNDIAARQPRPLKAVLSKQTGARLYLNRYFVDLK
jgi:hypothetical protein